MSSIRTTIATLRAKVTDASVDYVGSITIAARFCDALGLLNRQLIQIRNDATGVELHTYIIYGAVGTCPPDAVCLNGAAAHLVAVGDPVSITAYASVPAGCAPPHPRSLDVVAAPLPPDADAASHPRALGTPPAAWAAAPALTIPFAVGKVHRPRVTAVREPAAREGACVRVDAVWAAEAGLEAGREVHIVNTTSGQRDVLLMEVMAAGGRGCEVVFSGAGKDVVAEGRYGSRAGHAVGNVIIVMAYADVPRVDVVGGRAPAMRISFPFEAPADAAEDALNTSWHYSTRIVWNEPKLAKGVVDVLGLLRPGLRVLDCSCGNAFPALHMVKMGVKLTMCDGSGLAVKVAKERLAEQFGPTMGGADVRCLLWDQLADTFGENSFDVIIWRGNSLPYVGGDWNAPTSGDASKAAIGYQRLVTSAKAIYKTLAPGGTLYLDCVPATAEKGAVVKKQGHLPAEDGGGLVKLEWTFTVDEARRARRWESKTMIYSGHSDKGEERSMDVVVTALLVREQEIRSVLATAGFGQVHQTVTEGETVYQPFVTCKPVADVGANARGNGIAIGNGNKNEDAVTGIGCENITQLKPFGYAERQAARVEQVWDVNGGERSFAIFPGTAPSMLLPNGIPSSKGGRSALAAGTSAVHDFMAAKLKGSRDIAPQRVLHAGCRSGTATLDMISRLSKARVSGWNPTLPTDDDSSASLLALATDRAATRQVADRVTFSASSPEELGATDDKYDGCFSQEAISHVPAQSRVATVEAIGAALRPGAYFVLSDVVDGSAPISAAAQLHFKERLQYEDLWNVPKYMAVLKSAGLNVVEYFDLTAHCARTYKVLSESADTASRAADASGDREAASAYETLEMDYSLSGEAVQRGEIGWSMFVCQKATTASFSS